MTPFRALLMLTSLLMFAAVTNAQTLGRELHPLDQAAQQRACPVMCGYCWYDSALDHTAAVWQRVRMLVSIQKQKVVCCEAASAKAANCAAGSAGSVKGAEVGQTPKACCCAKACACCESCKAKKDTTAGVYVAPTPLTQEMLQRIAALRGITQWQPALPAPAPFPMACVPPVYGSGVVQVMPVPSARVVEVVPVVVHVRPVHLSTPDLDAHCERMTHRGDTVVLEGNVLLLCKKHAQPLRIEAQRVVVNMKDGSFTVESTATSFGVQRTSDVHPAAPPWSKVEPLGCSVDTNRVTPTGGTTMQCPGSSNCNDLFRLLMQYCR